MDAPSRKYGRGHRKSRHTPFVALEACKIYGDGFSGIKLKDTGKNRIIVSMILQHLKLDGLITPDKEKFWTIQQFNLAIKKALQKAKKDLEILERVAKEKRQRITEEIQKVEETRKRFSEMKRKAEKEKETAATLLFFWIFWFSIFIEIILPPINGFLESGAPALLRGTVALICLFLMFSPLIFSILLGIAYIADREKLEQLQTDLRRKVIYETVPGVAHFLANDLPTLEYNISRRKEILSKVETDQEINFEEIKWILDGYLIQDL